MHQNSENVISDTIFNCFQDQKITGNKDEKLKSRWDKVFKKGTSKVFERLSSTYFYLEYSDSLLSPKTIFRPIG